MDARDPAPEQGLDELLPGLDDEWVLRARAELDDRRAAALAALAERAEKDGDHAAALRWTRRLCELRPPRRGRPPDPGGAAGAGRRTGVGGGDGARVLRAVARGGRRTALAGDPGGARAGARGCRGGGAVAGLRPGPGDRLADRAVARGGRRARAGRRAGRRGGDRQVHADRRAGPPGHCRRRARAPWRPASTSRARRRSPRGSTWPGDWPRACARSRPTASWPAELNRLSSGLGARLGHPQQPPAATAPELERLRVFEAVLRLVEWSCAERPTLLVLDDAHRADRASLRLAAYVGRRLATLPVLLVLVRREGVRRPELDGLLADLSGRGVAVSTLDVQPISDSEVGALARSLHALDGDDVEKVVAAAEGNPLLAVETIRALVAGSAGPPPNLRAAVGATVSRLPDPTVAVVELLAAAGRPLRPAELRRLDVPTGADLVSGSEGLLVRRDGLLGFRHELLRAAVYAGLGDPVGLHDRLADGVDPGEHVERAHHLAAAGRRTESAAALAAAAAQARSVGALDEAAELLQRAVAATPDDGALWLELEEVFAWAHRRRPTWSRPGQRRSAASCPTSCPRRGAAGGGSSAVSPAIPRSRCWPTGPPSA